MRISLMPLFMFCSTLGFCLEGEQAKHSAQTSDSEYELIMSRVREYFAYNPPADNVNKLLLLFNDKEGSFSDVDYDNKQITNWKPLVHVERLYEFAFAYTNPENHYYKNKRLYAAIEKGLRYWHERNPQCDNWWYNQIGEPKELGVLLIQMRAGAKLLPKDLEQMLLQRILSDGGHPKDWTGANRTDIALHWIYRACLTEDEADLRLAVDYVYNTVVRTTDEGFQFDNSFMQHGKQLYIGGYGEDIARGLMEVALYTRSTSYAMSPEKIELFCNYMRETYFPTIRGQHMLFDVMGRSVSRVGNTKKLQGATLAENMSELCSEHAAEFNAIAERIRGDKDASYEVKPKHTHYFNADYTLHVRPSYTFDVRLSSKRTSRCEYGNEENLKTYFMSDGCTNIVTSGAEYADIFPVWNWARIPGTTAPQRRDIPMAPKAWQTPGTAVFAGGVSDSLYGVTAYSCYDGYAGINTRVRKAWFFFDDEVVCLGAGITSLSGDDINTTINQCLTDEATPLVAYAHGERTPLTQGVVSIASPEWIMHGDVAYLFPQGGNVYVERELRRGNWYDINHSQPQGEVQHMVFTLGIDHGVRPNEDTYAYIVLFGKETPDEVDAYRVQSDVEIAVNEAGLQVVRHRGLGLWQMVFYEARTFVCDDIEVTVDSPCVLMIKVNGDAPATLHVAEVAQNGTNKNVSLTFPHVSNTVHTIHCPFWDCGVYAGCSRTFTVE